MIHEEIHPLAGKRIYLSLKAPHSQLKDSEVMLVEDWWDRVSGNSWIANPLNPACLIYSVHRNFGLPLDDEVVYGKVGGLGQLVHDSELGTPLEESDSE
jgi:hypothetical protein